MPRGSILGPLFLLIYTKDIILNINSFIRKYANDTSLYYMIIENPVQSSVVVNSDLSYMGIFSRESTKPIHLVLHMNRQLTSHKHLGLTLSNGISWNEHVESIDTKAWHLI